VVDFVKQPRRVARLHDEEPIRILDHPVGEADRCSLLRMRHHDTIMDDAASRRAGRLFAVA
jgi:hypothetical protein